MKIVQPSAKATSFPPLISQNAKLLILGSMPGQESLKRQQYYAFGRNSFWFIMGRLCGAGPDLDYAVRTKRLLEAGIALWDVLHHCERPGSLDSDIQPDSEVANDFATLLDNYPAIRGILFNGQKAAQAFRRHVSKTLTAEQQRISLETLPSTSPAHTGLTREEKLGQWREQIEKYVALPTTRA